MHSLYLKYADKNLYLRLNTETEKMKAVGYEFKSEH